MDYPFLADSIDSLRVSISSPSRFNSYFLVLVHCWDYRRLLLSHVGMSVDDELKFSSDCLRNNFSNYSAWHYRSTVLDLNEESISNELKLIQDATFTDPADTSAWFYLNWVINNPSASKEALTKQLEAIDQLIDLEPESKCNLNNE